MPVAFKEANGGNGQNITPLTCLEEQSTLQQILNVDDDVV